MAETSTHRSWTAMWGLGTVRCSIFSGFNMSSDMDCVSVTLRQAGGTETSADILFFN
jgi:hypothetical protein